MLTRHIYNNGRREDKILFVAGMLGLTVGEIAAIYRAARKNKRATFFLWLYMESSWAVATWFKERIADDIWPGLPK